MAAISVGIVDGEILLDLNYEEDSRADVDMNFVMTAGNKIVELQATAEHQVFDDAQLAKMMSLARQGIQSLIAKQQACWERWPCGSRLFLSVVHGKSHDPPAD